MLLQDNCWRAQGPSSSTSSTHPRSLEIWIRVDYTSLEGPWGYCGCRSGSTMAQCKDESGDVEADLVFSNQLDLLILDKSRISESEQGTSRINSIRNLHSLSHLQQISQVRWCMDEYWRKCEEKHHGSSYFLHWQDCTARYVLLDLLHSLFTPDWLILIGQNLSPYATVWKAEFIKTGLMDMETE